MQTEKTVLHYLLYPESKRGRQKLKMDSCLLTQYESPSAAAIRQKKADRMSKRVTAWKAPRKLGCFAVWISQKTALKGQEGLKAPQAHSPVGRAL